MQINEFIEATGRLETYYGKDFSTEQRQIMFEEMKDFSIERYKKLISKCLKTCKYMPKIADIFAANLDLAGEIGEKENREIYSCNKCDSTGYVLYTQFRTNGNVRIPYTYAARCDCENAKYVNQKVPTYEELGIKVSNRLNQLKDTTRSMEQLKERLVKDFSI